MLVCVIISAAILIAYIVAQTAINGLSTSISETYYKSSHKWLFSLTLALSGSLIIIPWITASKDGTEGLAFLAVAALFFVAASPAFKEDLTKQVHYGAAFIMAGAIVAWEALNSGLWAFIASCLIIGLLNSKNLVFWLEIGLLLEVYGCMVLHYI